MERQNRLQDALQGPERSHNQGSTTVSQRHQTFSELVNGEAQSESRAVTQEVEMTTKQQIASDVRASIDEVANGNGACLVGLIGDVTIGRDEKKRLFVEVPSDDRFDMPSYVVCGDVEAAFKVTFPVVWKAYKRGERP
jgi:hypothetical protein